MKRKAKKVKRKKLEPKARIRRRLMKLWTMAVHAEFDEKCAVCGSTSLPNAHHIESRIMFKGLRYDPMNGVLLCPTHHKFGKDSAHMAGCWFATWLKEHLPERFDYVLAHHADPDPDLEDREVLAAIEASLRTHIAKYEDRNRVAKLREMLPDISEEEVRASISDLVSTGDITQEYADELARKVFSGAKGNLEKVEKENNEGNTTVQG